MAKRNYNKMYEENQEAAPAEESVVESAEADQEVVEAPKKFKKEKEKERVADDIPSINPFMGIVTGGLNLNVRKSPNGEIIAVIPEGAQVRVLDDSNEDWYKIESPKGYVMKKYIKKG